MVLQMERYRISQSSLKGQIAVPASKSHTLRAILFAALANGKSVITHYLHSTDTHSMIDACRLFGASIDIFPDRLEIQGLNGTIRFAEDVIHAGNSGIVLRFCTAVGALSSHPIVVTGDHSIRHLRPIKPLLDGLSQLGASTSSLRGDHMAPVIVQGPIRSGLARISGEDSQPVSALLIAAAFAEGPFQIEVTNPGEKPWVALTLDWFDRLGILYTNENFERYHIPGYSRYEGFEYCVPGDLSSAAFPIAAALITQSDLIVNNVDLHDSQGDKELIAIFKRMGADITFDEKQKKLHVKGGKTLSGITVDINPCVDAITILAVVGCFASGATEIRNGAIARQKECNRIASIVQELKKMGADIAELDDGLIVKQSSLKGADLHSHNDHRMAMSLAVAALGAHGETTISPVACVSKTFPTFLTDFAGLGAAIEGVSH